VTLRWGLLGTARINRRLIPAIRASGRSTVAAVGSRDAARAVAYAAQWNIPDAYGSYEALLASPVDVVYIALPNSLHVPWTLKAIAAGRHVLCEKPLGLSAQEIDTVIAAARGAQVVVAEGFMYRHHAQTASLLEAVHSGLVGELRAIVTGFSYLRTRDDDIRLEPALGGGALWDIGCYPVSLAQLLSGPVLRVDGRQIAGPTGIDEEFCGTLTHTAGAMTQFWVSFRAAYQTYLRIIGSSGTIDVDRPFRPGLIERLRVSHEDTTQTLAVKGNPIFTDEVTDMEDAVLGLRPPRLSLEQSRMHVATLAALHESARTGLHLPVA